MKTDKKMFEAKYRYYKEKVYFELTLMKRFEGQKNAWNRANERRELYLQIVRDLEDIADIHGEKSFDYCEALKRTGHKN